MAKKTKDIKTDLLYHGFNVAETDYSQRGYHLEVVLQLDHVRKLAETAYQNGFYLVFVAGCHIQPEEVGDTLTSGLQVIYQFASYDRLCRIKGRVSVSEDMTVPSISNIYQGANWHERETHDFYGIRFSGHPNLEPLLLTEEDVDFHPLLKEEAKLKSFDKVSWPSEVPDIGEAKTEA